MKYFIYFYYFYYISIYQKARQQDVETMTSQWTKRNRKNLGHLVKEA